MHLVKNNFVEKLILGDEKCLARFVTENQDMVFKTCLGYVQNEHDAADLTQNVFIKAFEKLKQYKGEAKISTWLIRIAINLSINYLRDNKKRMLHDDISQVETTISDTNNFRDDETRKVVRKAIYSLPEKQRKVFILSFYLQFSYKEIAETTGLSVSSIESLLFRGRKKLKSLLHNYHKEYF